MRVLFIEDDDHISTQAMQAMGAAGFTVLRKSNGAEGIAAAIDGRNDLIVLDLGLPDMDGLAVLQRLRLDGVSTPVLILTARGGWMERVEGLNAGADDYLPKPFNPRELLSRIKAVLRRSENQEVFTGNLSGRKVHFAHLTLEVDRQVLVDKTGHETALTVADFKLLMVLLERPRMVLSRDQLLDLSQGISAGPLDRKIDNQISRLRRKLEPDILRPSIIKTIRGGGYCLSVDVEVSG